MRAEGMCRRQQIPPGDGLLRRALACPSSRSKRGIRSSTLWKQVTSLPLTMVTLLFSSAPPKIEALGYSGIQNKAKFLLRRMLTTHKGNIQLLLKGTGRN